MWSLLNWNPVSLLSSTNPFTALLRSASKKAVSSKRNSKQRKIKYYGVRVPDNAEVRAHHVIVKQNRMKFQAGMNVMCDYWPGRFMVLKAIKSGTVRFTCERTNLDYNNSLVQKFYADVAPDTAVFKKYVHVIPPPRHNRFKLVEQI